VWVGRSSIGARAAEAATGFEVVSQQQLAALVTATARGMI
jgi:hypothetical protein